MEPRNTRKEGSRRKGQGARGEERGRRPAANRHSSPGTRHCEPHAPRTTDHGSAFTLVELLTVIAIIAILATLLSTSLASAKRKARQAGCTANLRQIALAVDMYLDDHHERPPGFEPLVTERYLPNTNSFRCPEDKAGNWGTLVEGAFFGGLPVGEALGGTAAPASGSGFAYSYLSPLWWDNAAWGTLKRLESVSGVATCQLHGLRRLDEVSLYAYEGLILRAQRDGAVVRRQIFWSSLGFLFDRTTDFSGPAVAPPLAGPMYPWPLFTDATPEQLSEP